MSTPGRSALAGDAESQDYYRIFPDRKMPDAYEANLREIFPDEHPGRLPGARRSAAGCGPPSTLTSGT